MIMPDAFGRLFGSSGIDVGNQLNMALCIFSLMLIPYSILANLRVIYQIIGYSTMSVALSIAQLVVMVLFVWLFALVSPKNLWWGFPVSAVVLLLIVLLKDDGRPFNPMLHETPEGIEHLGLRLVNSTNHSMTYKYMYDQNMVYMSFPVTDKPPI